MSDFSYWRSTELLILNFLKDSARPYILFGRDCKRCDRSSIFLLDGDHGKGRIDDPVFLPNWRERLVFSECNLKNRTRLAYSLIQNLPKVWKILIKEQGPSLNRSLKEYFPNLIGSDYLSRNLILGTVDEIGVSHEEIKSSSIDSKSLKSVFCLDVREHIPKLVSTIKEIYRVLNCGVKFISTFLFERQSLNTYERAIKIANETVSDFFLPQYYRKTILSRKILSYRKFGWNVIENCKYLEFKSVKIGFGLSEQIAHLGPKQTALVAER